MARIDERRQMLEAKLKEMSEDGVMPSPPKETLAFDPPDDEEEGSAKTDCLVSLPDSEHFSAVRAADAAASSLTIEDYRMQYLQSVRIREKTAFTMNVDTLQILRNVLQDLEERVSMASYIDNILRQHLKAHKELLNNATAKRRRKATIML